MNRRQGLSRPSAIVFEGRAETVLERRKREKKEEENVMKYVDYNQNFSEKLVSLNLHHPGKNTLITFNSPSHSKEEATPSFEELPGGLEMEEKTTQKYFGQQARTKFFERFQWLSKQREKLIFNNEDELKLFNENEHSSQHNSIPFAPRRPDMNENNYTIETFNMEKEEDQEDEESSKIYEENSLEEDSERDSVDLEEEEDYLFIKNKKNKNKENLFTLNSSDFTLKLKDSFLSSKLISDKEHNYSLGTSIGIFPSTSFLTSGEIDESNKLIQSLDSSRPKSASILSQKFQLDKSTASIFDNPQFSSSQLNKTDSMFDNTQFSRNLQKFEDDCTSIASIETLDTMDMLLSIKNHQYYVNPTTNIPLNNSKDSFPKPKSVPSLALETSIHDTDELYEVPSISSPRTIFISECIKNKINPHASLVLRKHMTRKLNLQHLSMGDEKACILAKVLKHLPHIITINISDNKLTDISLSPILEAINGDSNQVENALTTTVKPSFLSFLSELNLSSNEIGPKAASALYRYLVNPKCPLKTLILNNADVDDNECGRFIEAIQTSNTNLTVLELSRNKIGSDENLNTIMPEIVTGGEAIAELLSSPLCRLQKLKLDWNMIRLGGAIDLCSSLSINNTLITLDLSYNSLSTDGGVTLGVSLIHNTCLETLIVSNNNLDSFACFTICVGVIENRSLKKIVLDGNPIGRQGSRALTLIPIIAGNRVKVTANKCNSHIRHTKLFYQQGHHSNVTPQTFINQHIEKPKTPAKVSPNSRPSSPSRSSPSKNKGKGKKEKNEMKKEDKPKMKKKIIPELPKRTLDFDKLIGEYILDMSNGYERAVALILLHLIAGHPTYIFSRFQHKLGKNLINIDLESAYCMEKIRYFTPNQRSISQNLQRIREASSDIHTAIQLFQEVDIDGSGHLDSEELEILMKKLGADISEKQLQELINEFDTDGGGEIEIPEFIMLLKSQEKVSADRLKEMLCQPVMKLNSQPKKVIDYSDHLQLHELINFNFQPHLFNLARNIDIPDLDPITKKMIDTTDTQRYIPPTEGTLYIQVKDGFAHKNIHRVVTSTDKENLSSLTCNEDDERSSGSTQLPFGSKLRVGEATNLAKSLIHQGQSKTQVLLQMFTALEGGDPKDARSLIDEIIGKDANLNARLKREGGAFLNPLIGRPNGFYSLNLSKANDRFCLNKLLEISTTQAIQKATYGTTTFGPPGSCSNMDNYENLDSNIASRGLGDVSQNGDYSAFRNAIYQNKPIIITPEFGNPLPTTGIIEFDFFGTQKADLQSCLPISDSRLVKVLLSSGLLDQSDVGVALGILDSWDKKINETYGCNGINFFESKLERAQTISEYLDLFYLMINQRSQNIKDFADKELFLAQKINESEEIPTSILPRMSKINSNSTRKSKIGTKSIISNSITDLKSIMPSINEEPDIMTAVNNFKASFLPKSPSTSSSFSIQRKSTIKKSRSKSLMNANQAQFQYIFNNFSYSHILDAIRQLKEKEKAKNSENIESSSSINTNLPIISSSEADLILNESLYKANVDDNFNFAVHSFFKKQEEIEEEERQRIELEKVAVFEKNVKLEERRSAYGSRASVFKVLKTEDEVIIYSDTDSDEDDENLNNQLKPISPSKQEVEEEEEISEFTIKNKAEEDWEMTLRILKEAMTAKTMQNTKDEEREIFSRRTKNIGYHDMVDEIHIDMSSLKIKEIIQNPSISSMTKAQKIVEYFSDAFSSVWIQSKHLALLVLILAKYSVPSQNSIYVCPRAELCVLLMDRVIDSTNNISIVTSNLFAFELAVLIGRVGYLNIFSPCSPEGGWELDLSRYEERVIAKMLCVLATHEPGDNWIYGTFRWQRHMDPMPGWELTQPWLTEEGIPNRGILTVSYYSGEGVGKNGCKPYVSFRKSLLKLTSSIEKDFFFLVNKKPSPDILPGDKCFKKHYSLWDNYLLRPMKKEKKN